MLDCADRAMDSKRTIVIKISSLLVVGVFASLNFVRPTQAQVRAGAVPPGTVINYGNWKQYKGSMTAGMQALFEGDLYWKLPKEVEMHVGQTTAIPLPQKYLENTAKFAKAVKLVQTPEGGYIPQGYVAGMPFSDFQSDSELRPYELFWDTYYHYAPRLERRVECNYTGDSFGNFTLSGTGEAIYSELTHLSDVGFLMTIPNSSGRFLAKYYQQISPEQGKYTTLLDITYDDPTRLDDIYSFVPSMRRPLRLSQAARCAPLIGTDFTWEDANLGVPSLPQEFKIRYLGDRRILALVHVDGNAFETCGRTSGLPKKYFYLAGQSVVPWARPGLGNWEFRDVYVLEMERLPPFSSNYCYSKRIIYVDKETFFPLTTELYDPDGKFYRYIFEFLRPLRVPNTGIALGVESADEVFAINFKDKHLSVSATESPCSNGDCSADYLDISLYASPDGLAKIGQ